MFDADLFEFDSAFAAGASGQVRKCHDKAELSEWFAGFSMACGLLIPAEPVPEPSTALAVCHYPATGQSSGPSATT